MLFAFAVLETSTAADPSVKNDLLSSESSLKKSALDGGVSVSVGMVF